ncbi:hypothetical protein SERLA73DRAFT_185873 [Serpula lacrymans var. lacrymans S7.3]|uniref:Uncharacterized protein n=2 Tax=Serpula lacrymans var. lacrymans TaxID=341189 RepID=F8Q6J1_SERL3|nr:uncharacterized protein SERLADRAFT_474614 [Serpula lacrymans var. lacrymans S7.9]EGN96229.1 hypothetical protein SERLA73DRAFT_185873 [Serpula lacrymans var. lacrymans S7.3]EGO21765.1 hypothetical protein SERLADRAFT_474614 [Serpula lacrymans var. lacrymans S7.9]
MGLHANYIYICSLPTSCWCDHESTLLRSIVLAVLVLLPLTCNMAPVKNPIKQCVAYGYVSNATHIIAFVFTEGLPYLSCGLMLFGKGKRQSLYGCLYPE